MMIDLPPLAITLLKEILPVLSEAASQHSQLHHSEEIVEPWTPSDADEEISCPDLTVEILQKADRLRQILHM